MRRPVVGNSKNFICKWAFLRPHIWGINGPLAQDAETYVVANVASGVRSHKTRVIFFIHDFKIRLLVSENLMNPHKIDCNNRPNPPQRNFVPACPRKTPCDGGA